MLPPPHLEQEQLVDCRVHVADARLPVTALDAATLGPARMAGSPMTDTQ